MMVRMLIRNSGHLYELVRGDLHYYYYLQDLYNAKSITICSKMPQVYMKHNAKFNTTN